MSVQPLRLVRLLILAGTLTASRSYSERSQKGQFHPARRVPRHPGVLRRRRWRGSWRRAGHLRFVGIGRHWPLLLQAHHLARMAGTGRSIRQPSRPARLPRTAPCRPGLPQFDRSIHCRPRLRSPAHGPAASAQPAAGSPADQARHHYWRRLPLFALLSDTAPAIRGGARHRPRSQPCSLRSSSRVGKRRCGLGAAAHRSQGRECPP